MTGFTNRRAALAVVVAVLALTTLLLSFAAPAAPGDVKSSASVKFPKNPEHTIEVGLHIVNIHQFSMKDKVYSVEGWYWLKWPREIQQTIQHAGIKDENILEFMNSIETSSLTVDPDNKKPKDLCRGSEVTPKEVKDCPIDKRYKYQLFKFSGRFYVSDLSLQKSPFETFDLPIVFETRPEELSCEKNGAHPCVYLEPYRTSEQGLVGEFAEINGFKQVGSSIVSSKHQYTTNFGFGKASAFGRVEYKIRYKTDFWSAFMQDVLPVLIILAFVLVSPRIPSSMWDVRLAVPATALLTLIFLQQTYRSEIPSLSYLTFMDWLYAFAYLVSMSLFILFCWGAYRYSAVPENEQPAITARITRIDTAFQRIAILGLGVTVLLAWVL